MSDKIGLAVECETADGQRVRVPTKVRGGLTLTEAVLLCMRSACDMNGLLVRIDLPAESVFDIGAERVQAAVDKMMRDLVKEAN